MRIVLALAWLASLVPLTSAAAAAGGVGSPLLPSGFELAAVPGAGNVTYATVMRFAPDGRLFVGTKDGRVSAHDGAAFQALPVLDLASEVYLNGDRGLLGMALHPGFVADGGATSWLYLLYVASPIAGQDPAWGANQQFGFGRVARYRIEANGALLQADPASRQVLLGNQLADGTVPDGIASIHTSHSIGCLEFASDGTLFVSAGDGAHFDVTVDAGGLDPAAFDAFVHPTTGLKGPTPIGQDLGAWRAASLDSLSSKVLRIDPESGLGLSTNPFFDGDPASLRSRVWALGLRNPFRLTLTPGTGSSDPMAGDPGELLVGDVGHLSFEEITRVHGGENCGWPCSEGPASTPDYASYVPPGGIGPSCQTPPPGSANPPLVAWNHVAPGAVFPAGLTLLDAAGQVGAGFTGACAIGGEWASGSPYPPPWSGRYFFGDYVEGWVKTLVLDGAGNLTGVQDFGSGVGPLVDMALHPLTAELHLLILDGTSGRIGRLRWSQNQTPIAKATVAPQSGAAPLAVHFDASASFDPDGDVLALAWDFGDGSPSGTGPIADHDYASGSWTATLTASDPGGLFGTLAVPIHSGNTPPALTLVSPLQGTVVEPPLDLALEALASDAEGTVTIDWEITLHHDTHEHPGFFVAVGPSAVFPLADHGADGEIYFHEIEVRATDEQGLATIARAHVFSADGVRDLTGDAIGLARVFELVPPQPLGSGNHDLEVARDLVLPAPGNASSALQFDTFHFGDQGNDDWVGWQAGPSAPSERFFFGLDFVEGKHFSNGGWFEDFWVEVRDGGVWQVAQNLRIDPPYPFELAAQPFFDGIGFQRYTLAFDPMEGDSARLRGKPGGSAKFISVAELRALAAVPAVLPLPYRDITAEGSVVAKVLTLIPPFPTGDGNRDPETLRNGTTPAAGSTSEWAQFDTEHAGTQGNDDWLGIAFTAPRSIARLSYQEGLNEAEGGSFETLSVELQAADGSWFAAPSFASNPPYVGEGAGGTSYETFDITLAPTLAYGVRLRGDPSGTLSFTSAAELRVFEPELSAGCGFASYGTGLPPPHTLSLSAGAPAALGLPLLLDVAGAAGAGSGLLGVAAGQAAIPLLGGTLLVDPLTLTLHPLAFDAAGNASFAAPIPNDPPLLGVTLDFQAVALGSLPPLTLAFSSGLELALCAW